jgi:hypothetical protein
MPRPSLSRRRHTRVPWESARLPRWVKAQARRGLFTPLGCSALTQCKRTRKRRSISSSGQATTVRFPSALDSRTSRSTSAAPEARRRSDPAFSLVELGGWTQLRSCPVRTDPRSPERTRSAHRVRTTAVLSGDGTASHRRGRRPEASIARTLMEWSIGLERPINLASEAETRP